MNNVSSRVRLVHLLVAGKLHNKKDKACELLL